MLSANAINNVDLSGCDVYVGTSLVGATKGKCGVSYSPTIKEYSAGYPAYTIGAEIVKQSAKIALGILELTDANIAMAFADVMTTTDAGGTVFYKIGTNTQPVVLENLLFHKYNPGNGKHLVLKVWKAYVTSECAVQFEQNSEEFFVFDVAMNVIGDPQGHPNFPLFEMTFGNTFTPPAAPLPPANT